MSLKNIIEKINSTVLLAIILIISNTIYFIEAIITGPLIENSQIGVSFFPVVVSVLFYLSAITILIAGLKEKSILPSHITKYKRPIMVIILTFLYVLIFKTLGYFISSIIYVSGLILVFEDESYFKAKKFINIMYSLIIVILVYLLYQKLFGVRLPIGEVL